MRFYASKIHNNLNGRPFEPETYCDYLCINPYYKCNVINDAKFMIDSGAFQDVGTEKRLSFEDALKRQLDFEFTVTESHRPQEQIVSYDRLVDEQFGEKGQFKQRVSEQESKEYVRETIEQQRFLQSKREELRPRKLILSCQGTTAEQYIYCLNEVLKVQASDDIIGLGGFCIISKSKEYEQQFYEVIKRAFPLIASKGITRVHIFGVGIFRVLIQAEILARINGITLSYDTSQYERRGVFGGIIQPSDLTSKQVFTKLHKHQGYEPQDLAKLNIMTVLDFWNRFSDLPYPSTFNPSLLTAEQQPEQADCDYKGQLDKWC